MPNSLVSFWKKFNPPGTKPYLHPDDRDWFEKKEPTATKQEAESFESFIRGTRFGREDKHLHLSLLPSPFHGNLDKANIFILLMNPGFSDSDYYAYEHPAFRAASIANLRQKNIDRRFPYFSLDPQFAWSGAYRWIASRMGPILHEIAEKRNFSYYEALSFLSKQIAVIELFPYHSGDGRAIPNRVWRELPSVIEARTFVRDELCRSPKRPLILMARSRDKWDISDKSIFGYSSGRVITFNPKLKTKAGDAGKAILAKLNIS